MIERQNSSGISAFDFSTIASPVAMAIPSSPSHRPKKPMTAHSTVVTAGHGDSTTNTGAKKETFTAKLDAPAASVILTWKAQPESVMSAVTADISYHGDDKLVPHHSYLYPRVTVTPSGGSAQTFDFPTNGLSWYG